MKLFLLYVIENKISKFGARWKARESEQLLNIWIDENSIINFEAANYEIYLSFFVTNDLVYASEWTEYNNPREYTLYNSLQDFLFDEKFPFLYDLREVKERFAIPF